MLKRVGKFLHNLYTTENTENTKEFFCFSTCPWIVKVMLYYDYIAVFFIKFIPDCLKFFFLEGLL